MSKLNKRRFKLFLYHSVMVLICLFFLFPFYYITTNALKIERLIISYPPVWFFQPTFQHFINVIIKYKFHYSLINSFIVSFCSIMIGLGIAALAAYAFVRYRLRKMVLVILAAWMIPYVLCLIPLYVLFYNFGWLDTYGSLILAHLIISVPQSVLILMSFIEGIPKELEESALIEGCSRIKVFLYIVLPLIRPGLVAAGALSFAISWNDFKLALVLAGGHTTTAPLALFNFIGVQSADWGGLSASATIMVIPTVIFVLLIQKQLVRGLTMGGV